MTLEKKLREMGHEVFIFTIDPDKEDKIISPNVIYFSGITVPISKLNSYKLSLRSHIKVKIVKKYNLDIIHLQTEFSMARLATIASKKYKIPLVYTLHTLYEDYLQYISKTIDEYFHKPFLASLAKLLISPINKRATTKIVPSRKTLSMISKYYIDGDVRVIPTGLDLNSLLAKKEDDNKLNLLKEKMNIKDKKIFLFLGRVSEEKSINVLINSFAKAVKINPNMVFLVVGDGPNLNYLKQQAKDLGLTDNEIKFLGFIEWNDIVPYYQIADAFLNASTTETQGLTYIEALACGTPLIVKYDEVLDDIVKVGENGFYFNNDEELTNLLLKFTNDDLELSKLKDTTFKSIAKYDEDNFAKSIYNVYIDTIKKYKERKQHFFTKI